MTMHPLFDVRKFKGYVLCISHKSESLWIAVTERAFRCFQILLLQKEVQTSIWCCTVSPGILQSRANLARGKKPPVSPRLFSVCKKQQSWQIHNHTHTYSTHVYVIHSCGIFNAHALYLHVPKNGSFGSSLIPQEFTSASSMECVVNTTTDCFRFSATSWKINGWVWWDAWIHALWMASKC